MGGVSTMLSDIRGEVCNLRVTYQSAVLAGKPCKNPIVRARNRSVQLLHTDVQS